MALFAFYMANETDTTRIFFELIHIKALAGGHCARPGGGIALYSMKAVDGRLGGDIVNKRDGKVREGVVDGWRTRHRRVVSSQRWQRKGMLLARKSF